MVFTSIRKFSAWRVCNASKYGDIIEMRGTHAVSRNLVGNPTNSNILRSVIG